MAITKGFIAVHVGAGKHSSKLEEDYKRLCREACLKGITSLKSSNNILEAVVDAVIVLENSPLTNAGYGSNLTFDGKVECDASVMDGSNLQFGSVGAITGVKNPIQVAKCLCQLQTKNIGHGRVPPSFLVGDGAYKWAKQNDITLLEPKNLISDQARKVYKRYKKKIESDGTEVCQKQPKRMDTVGAVGVDEFGNIASACSSGGIILKFPGRIGQAAIWGCGAWASMGSVSVGTSTSGCGEHLVRTNLARTIAESIKSEDEPILRLHDTMQNEFINSKYLTGLDKKLGGVIAIRYSADDDCGDLLYCHSTDSMIIGYMGTDGKAAKSHKCTLVESSVGTNCTVEGIPFRLRTDIIKHVSMKAVDQQSK